MLKLKILDNLNQLVIKTHAAEENHQSMIL